MSWQADSMAAPRQGRFRPATRPRGVPAGLSREAVLDAALVIAARTGFSGLTMRGLAVELGVTPMSLYSHVSSRDVLLDLVADRFLADVNDGVPFNLPALETVRRLARALRDAGVAHPGLLVSVVGHIPEQVPSAQMDYCDRVLNCMAIAGASPEAGHEVYRGIVMLSLTVAVATANLSAERSTSVAERLSQHVEHYRGRPIAQYLQASSWTDADVFDSQLDRLLAFAQPETTRPGR